MLTTARQLHLQAKLYFMASRATKILLMGRRLPTPEMDHLGGRMVALFMYILHFTIGNNGQHYNLSMTIFNLLNCPLMLPSPVPATFRQFYTFLKQLLAC